MLLLSRRKGESIMVGKDVQITVLSIKSGKVRIGVIAPQDVRVHRQEVFDEIEREAKENEP